MDLPTLTGLLQRSTLIGPEDKKFWLENLPTMKPAQLAKLESILSQAEKIPLKESVHQYFQAINTAVKPPLAA